MAKLPAWISRIKELGHMYHKHGSFGNQQFREVEKVLDGWRCAGKTSARNLVEVELMSASTGVNVFTPNTDCINNLHLIVANTLHDSASRTHRDLQSSWINYCSHIHNFIKMSFLFGGGRPQLTSVQKIEAAETELELVSDMFNRFVISLTSRLLFGHHDWCMIDSHNPV